MNGQINFTAIRTYAEVGKILGITAGGVYMLEKSALKKLRRALERKGIQS